MKFAWVVPALVLAASAGRAEIEPIRPGQQWFLKRAVFADGRLWALSDAGQLWSIQEDATAPAEEALPEPAVDVCVQGGSLVAVTCPRAECSSWTVRRRGGGKWSAEAKAPTNGDELVAAICSKDELILLTNRRVVKVSGGKPAAVALSEEMRGGLIASVYAGADQLLVGVDAGEWGGGLQRIDRRTGQVTTIERNETGELCGGPLNAACDPVNGIEAEPWHPGCVAATVGLVHFLPHGRIVEICGDQVTRLFSQRYGKPFPKERRSKREEPFRTVAFYGLARSGDALWAAGLDGLYRIEAGRVVKARPLPQFKKVGQLAVSFDVPHLVLVITGINQRRAISGGVPMLVPR